MPETDHSGKTRTLSAVLRLGHDAFHRGSFSSAASYVVNNSRLLADYDRSCLVRLEGGAAEIIAVSGQAGPAPASEYSGNILSIVEPFSDASKPERISPESLDSRGAAQRAREAYELLKGSSASYEIMAFPFLPPEEGEKTDRFIWIVEFFEPPPRNAVSVLALLSRHYAEALFYYAEKPARTGWKALLEKRRMTPYRMAAVSALVLSILLFAVRISNTANADFELVPLDESVEYAPFSGVLGACLRENGDTVKKGEQIISYRTEDFAFNLALAKKNFEEVSAELDFTRQKSFTDSAELGKIRILELRLEKEKIEIEKYEWFLEKSRLTAKMDGILSMDEKEKMAGKHVGAGEKLFEIVSTKKLTAEIRLDETDASVLKGSPSATLFLHARPETTLKGRITSVSPKPVRIEETGRFAYLMKMELSGDDPFLMCGMRGIAKVKGAKVSLAYFIFRSTVLWWRGI